MDGNGSRQQNKALTLKSMQVNQPPIRTVSIQSCMHFFLMGLAGMSQAELEINDEGTEQCQI